MNNPKTMVEERDESRPNSPISNSEEDSTITVDKDAKCLWNGQEFADGYSISVNGEHYVCNYGSWMKINRA